MVSWLVRCHPLSGDSTVCQNTLIVCYSDFLALLGNTCMHGVDYIKHVVQLVAYSTHRHTMLYLKLASVFAILAYM